MGLAPLWLPCDHQPPQVIPRPVNEMIVLADDLESYLQKVALDDRERYLVSRFSFGRPRSPIDDDQAAARPKRPKCMIDHQFLIAEFVIGITDQHGVHSACWQARIVFSSDFDVDIVLAPQYSPRTQE